MFEIPFEFSYLALNTPFFLVWALLFFFQRNTRELQLKTSLLGAVIGPLSEVVYLRDYWHPGSILSVDVLGHQIMFEAFLFGFWFVGIASTLYFSYVYPRIEHNAHLKKIPSAYLFFGVVVVALLFWVFGVNSIYASSLSLLAASCIIFSFRTDLLMPALLNGVLTTMVLFISYFFLFHIFSANAESLLKQIWHLYNTSLDVRLFSIPVTELVWSFTVGTFLFSWIMQRSRLYIVAEKEDIDNFDKRREKYQA